MIYKTLSRNSKLFFDYSFFTSTIIHFESNNHLPNRISSIGSALVQHHFFYRSSTKCSITQHLPPSVYIVIDSQYFFYFMNYILYPFYFGFSLLILFFFSLCIFVYFLLYFFFLDFNF